MAFLDPDIGGIAERQPRAVGTAEITTQARDGVTGLDRFRTSGALKALFPRTNATLEAILVNTSGGLTGGDRMRIDAKAGAGCDVTLTTQAAERAYRSAGGAARVETLLSVKGDGCLSWLPQELIVYDGAALARRLRVDLSNRAEFLMVEPVVFGRRAMGERIENGLLDDRIEIRRDGQPLYRDHLHLTGNVERLLGRNAVGRGAGAMASVVSVARGVEARLSRVRSLLPETGGATLLADDTLALRLLAKDGYDLRRTLMPILACLGQRALPRSWSL